MVLFIITFFTTTLAGTQWQMKDYFDPSNWVYGLSYSVSLIFFLSVHEFGHYLAARYHKVNSTLPYFIPLFIPGVINFGTFGAVIKTMSPIPNRKAMFDIGAWGPLPGFVVSLGLLIYGLLTLPPIDFIYQLHPEYLTDFKGVIPDSGLHFGDTILYLALSKILANPTGFLPPMNEIYHYPYLCVGWFGLFVTTLNMLPIGQLDGGHIVYSMFGKLHTRIARIAWWIIFSLGIVSMVGVVYDLLNQDFEYPAFIFIKNLLYPGLDYVNTNYSWVMGIWEGWFVWALVMRFILKIEHPVIYDYAPLSPARRRLGWATLIILMLSFPYNGIYIK
jgi:membrane-associated protease RseP (regulator of RpoE activity)